MTRSVLLHDRATIAAALGEHRALHLYALGDLDDFFFPHTIWHALEEEGRILEIALVYAGAGLPCLLGLTPGDPSGMRALLRAALPLLPRRFEAHLSPGVAGALEEEYDLCSSGLHRKMVLAAPERLASAPALPTVALGPPDRAEVEGLYATAYPGNWFDPRMLETGRYVGVREGGALVSVAGVHVYSPVYRAAALGNITTHPAFRGRGFAAAAIAALCRALLVQCEVIGLNVHAENRAAIGLYERLGFTVAASYEEVVAEVRLTRARA